MIGFKRKKPIKQDTPGTNRGTGVNDLCMTTKYITKIVETPALAFKGFGYCRVNGIPAEPGEVENILNTEFKMAQLKGYTLVSHSFVQRPGEPTDLNIIVYRHLKY